MQNSTGFTGIRLCGLIEKFFTIRKKFTIILCVFNGPAKQERQNMTRDLTRGSIWKHIIILAITTFLGMGIQQLYSLADTAIVGQVLGADPLAGVGATGSLNFMIVFFCIGICLGFGIPVSREFGARDYERMRRFMANGIWLSIGLDIIMTVITCVFCRQFLIWLNTPADILDYAVDYFILICAGLTFTIFYNLLSTVLRGLGDTRTPLIAIVISSLVNIGLDFFFLITVPMGVAGAALATVIAQGLSGVFCLIVLIRKFPIMHIQKPEWAPNGKMIKHLLGYGLPIGLQSSITAIGTLVLQASVNSFGVEAVAGMTVATKITFFFDTPMESMGQIMTPFTAQNMGAKKYPRIKEALLKASAAGFACAIVEFPIVFFFGRSFVHIFLDSPTPQVVEYAYISILCVAASSFLLVIVNAFRFTIQGIGHTSLSMISGVLEMIGRIFAALVLSKIWGYTGIALGSTVAWILADCFLIPTFFISYRKLMQRKE